MGIHIILATQRPSVNVITGVIKANFPSRIAFQVASKTDSRTILDLNGAERLLGMGDMLFLPSGQGEPIRVHGAFISGEETERLVEALKESEYEAEEVAVFSEQVDINAVSNMRDDLFDEAVRLVCEHQQASTSFLQRRLKVGYSRAARLMDELEAAGIVGPIEGGEAAPDSDRKRGRGVRGKMRLWLWPVFCLGLAASAALGQSSEEIIARVQKRLTGYKTFSARFEKQFYWAALDKYRSREGPDLFAPPESLSH